MKMGGDYWFKCF